MTVLGFTRPSKRLADSIKEAEAMGFTVMAAPSLEISHGDESEFERLEASIGPGIPVIVGSSTAVEECQAHFGDRLPALLEGCRVVSIGPATTRKLRSAGVRVDDEPEDYSSYGLVELLKDDVRGRRVVVVRSDSGTDILSDGLREAGADLVDIASYKLKGIGMCPALLHMLMSIKAGRMDVMAFTSPMSASSFVGHLEQQFGKERGDAYLRGVKIAAIGRPTSERLRELGFEPDIVPENTTFHDMLQAISDKLGA